MKSIVRFLAPLALLCALSAPAGAVSYIACYNETTGTFRICPDDARLKTSFVLQAAYIPTLDAAKIGTGEFDIARIPTITEAKGGFGASVSGLGTGFLRRSGANSYTASAIAASELPTGIDAAKIGPGTVSNSIFAYLANVSSDIQTQLNGKQSTLTLPLSIANGGTGSATGSAAGLNNVPADQLINNVARARITSALATGGDPVVGTVVTASTRVDTPSIGPGVGAQHDIPGGTTRILTADSTEAVTGKSMSGASNTFTNIPANTALTSQVPVANGGTGASSLTANGLVYGSGTSPVGVAAAGTAGQVMTSNGSGSAPSMQNPITATQSTAYLSSSPYSLTTTNYENIGLSTALPSGGTYLVEAQPRCELNVSAAAPAEMTHKLVNITDTTDVSNSETYGPLATATGVLFTTNARLYGIVTVASGKTIGVYSKVNSGPTYTTRRCVSDGSGRSFISYIKLSS